MTVKEPGPKPLKPEVDVGTSKREYGNSSGDRNTKKDEGDWEGFHGGIQRDAEPESPREVRRDRRGV